jgi:nucleoside-diphosphate-sugar epimerase
MPVENWLAFPERIRSHQVEAHYEVALPLIEKGAPIIIVMPAAVYGPGDPSLLGDFMRAITEVFSRSSRDLKQSLPFTC